MIPTGIFLWKITMTWIQNNITRPGKLKTLFFIQMNKNLSTIFSLNVCSVYGSQQKEKKEVIKYFWNWIRNGKDVPEITSASLSLWCWHTAPQDLLLGFWTKSVSWKNKPVCGSDFVMSMHWTGSFQVGTAFSCSKWQNMKQLVEKKKKGITKKLEKSHANTRESSPQSFRLPSMPSECQDQGKSHHFIKVSCFPKASLASLGSVWESMLQP